MEVQNKKWWGQVSLHGSIKELSGFCGWPRGRLALPPWTSANPSNSDISGPSWGAFIKICSPSPFLVIVVLYAGCALCLYASERGRVSRVFPQVSPSFSLANIYLHSSCSCTACLLSKVLQSHHAEGYCFSPSLRELCSAMAFVVSIAANNLVRTLLTAPHWICHVSCPPCSSLPDDWEPQYWVR